METNYFQNMKPLDNTRFIKVLINQNHGKKKYKHKNFFLK